MGQGETVLRRWFLEVWNEGKIERFSEFAHPDLVLHTVGVNSERLVGVEGFRTLYDRLRSAFSDIKFAIEETMESDNKAAIRWTCTMRHTGNQMGIAPSGKTVRISGMAFVRLKDGKVTEAWDEWDRLGFMQQLGLVPAAA